MTIINLRGTNGSGKSTVALSILEKCHSDMVDLAEYRTGGGALRAVPGYHVPDFDLIIVGPYRTACGGCDAIKTQALVKESVILAARKAEHVFFEGVIVSTLFSGYLDLSRSLSVMTGIRPDDNMSWAYLNTPLETCLERIQKRNGGKPINEQLVADKVRSIESTRVKAEAAGERVFTIRHGRAVGDVMELLR